MESCRRPAGWAPAPVVPLEGPGGRLEESVNGNTAAGQIWLDRAVAVPPDPS